MANNRFISDLRTKFICTIGPGSASRDIMRDLIQEGACIFRNNFAHAQYDEYRARVQMVKELNEELDTDVKLQADIQGTNIRVGDMGDGFHIHEDGVYTFVTNGEERRDGELHINDDHLHEEVKVGEPITFMDGALEGEIIALDGHRITARMINGGLLKSRKSVNVPMTEMKRGAITDKDRRDLDFLINDAGVDWLALSFVGAASDVEEVRQMIGNKDIKIMSKIERRTAIENLNEIIVASDAVMIARGDLGIEMPMEEVPIIGKQMIDLAHFNNTPVVTATQMLLSMTHSLRPTRAEVSDVANAIFDGADAVMLSEETADGQNPIEALRTMVKIVRRVEQYLYNRPNNFEKYGL